MTAMDDSKPIYETLCQYCGEVVYFQEHFEEWKKEYCSVECIDSLRRAEVANEQAEEEAWLDSLSEEKKKWLFGPGGCL